MITSIQVYLFGSIPYENIEIENLLYIFRSETLNCHCTKTTQSIELKLKGPIEWVNKDLYTNFQSILNFHKNL